MSLVLVTPKTITETLGANLLKARLAEEYGCPLCPSERRAVEVGFHRCLTEPHSDHRLQAILSMKNRKPYAILMYRRRVNHLPLDVFNSVDAFTVPSHRGERLQKQLLRRLVSSSKRLIARVVVPPIDQTHESLPSLGFVVHPHRCVARTLPVHEAIRLRESRHSWREIYAFGNNDEQYSVRPSVTQDAAAITLLQEHLTLTVPLEGDPDGITAGVNAILRSPDMFSRGCFWSLLYMNHVIGTAKLLAELDPLTNRWVLYLRHIVLHPRQRGLGLLRYFVAGILTLALREGKLCLSTLPPESFLTIRSFIPDDDKVMDAFATAGFVRSSYRLADRVLPLPRLTG